MVEAAGYLRTLDTANIPQHNINSGYKSGTTEAVDVMTAIRRAPQTVSTDYVYICDALQRPQEEREQLLINIAERRDRQRGRGVNFIPMREVDKANMFDRWGDGDDGGGLI